jgi:TolA-binding protein
MVSAELHPEDLLERDARGELDEVGRSRLEAHLGRCAACRLERIARLDFRREAETLETSGEPAHVQQLLARVLASPRPNVAPIAAKQKLRARRVVPLLFAAAFVSAAAWATIAGRPVPRTAPTARTPPPSLPAAAPAPAPTGAPVADPVTPAVLAMKTPTAEPTPAPTARASRPTSATAQRAAFVVRALPDDPEAAGRDFDRANAARRSGQHGPAADLYRALIARYPGSAEAHASLVALGRMLLDDGDAAGALRSFDQYLSSGGAMVEDVMAGRAIALRNLGRPGDEVRAWRALLSQYPSSVHAERARHRLVELEAP